MLTSRLSFASLLGAVLVATLVRPSVASQTIDESPRAYEIVADTAIHALPTPIRGLLDARATEIRRIASKELLWVDAARNQSSSDATSHFILLDGGEQDRKHTGVVSRFPRSEQAARRLFAQHGVSEGGSLPWTLIRRVDELSHAFRQRDTDKVVRAAGAVVHYATDAALPFNTVADDANRRLVHDDLVRDFGDRFAYEVRVFPGRVGPGTSAIDDVFATLEAAHATVPPLQEIVQRSVVRSKSNRGSKTSILLTQTEAGGGCAIVESRLEDAALLAANLIVRAWETAGRPAWRDDATATASSVDRGAPMANWVGSVNSTIVHKADCPHARRIRPANRVTFISARDARQAGRSACKTCKPVLSATKPPRVP